MLPLTADAFYRLRDSRTNTAVGDLAYTSAKVWITTDSALRFADQVAFLTVVNLSARWCRHIRFRVPAQTIDPRLASPLVPLGTSIADAALVIARNADPFGDFAADEPRTDAYLRLHIGVAPDRDAFPICGRGWLASGGQAVTSSGDHENPLGAILAACFGVAHLFRAALRDPTVPSTFRFSLWDLQAGPAASDGPLLRHASLGRILLVGCGAVGSAIAYALQLTPLTGHFDLVDGDCVETPNLGSGLLFFARHIGHQKSRVVGSYLRDRGYSVSEHPRWFDEAVQREDVFVVRPDILIPAANERNVRWQVQQQLPPLQVYGTTGGNWQAFLGRHIPLREDCLACRFPGVQLERGPRLRCDEGAYDDPASAVQDGPTIALPFLPAAAAALAAAELGKVTFQGYPFNANFACLDFRGPWTTLTTLRERPRAGCFCRTQAAVWQHLNGSTRFSGLSVDGDH